MGKSLDTYDVLPEDMRHYLTNYGFHFSKKAFEKAVKMMKRQAPNGRMERLNHVGKDQVDSILQANGITLVNDVLYDSAYVYNMGMADYMGSSIDDELHLARYVKDVLDDPDGSDELPFRFWLQKLVAMGTPVDWEDLL